MIVARFGEEARHRLFRNGPAVQGSPGLNSNVAASRNITLLGQPKGPKNPCQTEKRSSEKL